MGIRAFAKKLLFDTGIVGIGVVIGAGGTFFLMSMFRALVSNSTSGNAADWWAAAGTWVIGIGAMFFAFEARKQTLEAERSRRFARQSHFMIGLAHAKTMVGIADQFIGDPNEEQTWATYSEVLDVLTTYAHEVNVAPDVGDYIPHDAAAGVVIVNEMLRIIRNEILGEKARVASVVVSRDSRISDKTMEGFVKLRSRLAGVRERCDTAIAQVNDQLTSNK